MSQRTIDAIRAREDAKRPKPEPRKRKAKVVVEEPVEVIPESLEAE